MHKRKLHHLLVRLRPIRYWYVLIALALAGCTSLFALRQNNLQALELRDKVLAVDKQNGNVEAALRELREFTYGHMNARLSSDTGIYPPIQLKYRYERLVAAEKKRVEKLNGNLYNQAQESCEARFPQGLYGSTRLPCIQAYIDSHRGAKEQPIPDALYKFDFVSPSWSPDLAGWSLIVTGVALVLLITKFMTEAWLKHQLDD